MDLQKTELNKMSEKKILEYAMLGAAYCNDAEEFASLLRQAKTKKIKPDYKSIMAIIARLNHTQILKELKYLDDNLLLKAIDIAVEHDSLDFLKKCSKRLSKEDTTLLFGHFDQNDIITFVVLGDGQNQTLKWLIKKEFFDDFYLVFVKASMSGNALIVEWLLKTFTPYNFDFQALLVTSSNHGFPSMSWLATKYNKKCGLL